MKKLLLIMFAASICCCGKQGPVPATEAPVRVTGRTMTTDDGGITFDWSGVYIDIRFRGTTLYMDVSDTGRNYFNLFVDGEYVGKFETQGEHRRIALFEEKDAGGEHLVRIQKATEGEQGRITVHTFETDGRFLSTKHLARPRYIEFYGDSLTCGYGSESLSGSDPFTIETENCMYSFTALSADHFDADYNMVAHSGRGVVRNYGDARPISDSGTMSQRAWRTFDESDEPLWDFAASPRRPDLIVVTLGTNDFSTSPQPPADAFVEAYRKLVTDIRTAYNEEIPVLCVVHSKYAVDLVTAAVEGLARTAVVDISGDVYNNTTDLGASSHPNRFGHRKIARIVIERMAELTGWK